MTRELKFEDLSLRLIPQQQPPKPPARIPFSLVHLKSGAMNLVLSVKARSALEGPEYVQVLADNHFIAIRKAVAGDQHSRKVSTSGAVAAIELVMAHNLETGERLKLLGVMDSGHLLATVPPRAAGSGGAK